MYEKNNNIFSCDMVGADDFFGFGCSMLVTAVYEKNKIAIV
jgi:hypothetical protein